MSKVALWCLKKKCRALISASILEEACFYKNIGIWLASQWQKLTHAEVSICIVIRIITNVNRRDASAAITNRKVENIRKNRMFKCPLRSYRMVAVKASQKFRDMLHYHRVS
jgi:hypothetical protein